VSIRKIPPVILRLTHTPSALEALMPKGNNMPTEADLNRFNAPTPTDEGSQFDRYVLAQYFLYLYINIFVNWYTSHIYMMLLGEGMDALLRNADKVKDVALRDLLRNYISPLRVQEDDQVKRLEALVQRLHPEEAFQGMEDVIAVVLAVYSRKRVAHLKPVMIQRITLQELDGYDSPAFVLAPIFKTGLDTNGFETQTPMTWKLINSMRIQELFREPGDLSYYLALLSMLALPMDPMDIIYQMRSSVAQNSKAGIPFLNYMAMYFRQQYMGIDYQLSRQADSRRILQRRLHQFCGIGGVAIADRNFALPFSRQLEGDHKYKFTDEDRNTLRIIEEGIEDDVVRFTRKLNYGEATEGKKTPADPAAKDETPDPDDDGAFASDDADLNDDPSPEPDPGQDPQNTTETGDNDIDRTSDVGQDFAAANAKTFIPLALPTETIDDHLLRRALLHYVSDMDKDPAPDITPENLELLKYWCDSWLFIASIDQTKKVISQLNLSEKLKELKL
jgi:DNA replication initiation complex subunit (GINS family)